MEFFTVIVEWFVTVAEFVNPFPATMEETSVFWDCATMGNRNCD